MDQKTYFYRSDGKLKRIDLDSILHIKASDNYVRVYQIETLEKLARIESLIDLDDQEKIDELIPQLEKVHLIRATLKDVMKKLPGHSFVQIHRSFAVAVKYVGTIEKEMLFFQGTAKFGLPISKQYYESLIRKIEILGPSMPEKENV